MNIITFDIEEWFHIQMDPKENHEQKWVTYEKRFEANMSVVLDLLDKHDQKATFFCLGWIARQYPEIISKLANQGHEIGTHSDMHLMAHTLSPREFEKDLRLSISTIEQLIGNKVRSYRAPAFSIKEENKWALELLIDNGIEVDCSIFPTTRDFGGFASFNKKEPCYIEINNKKIKEFPLNLYSVLGKEFAFSGGGYFRFFSKHLISHMMNNSEYVMTYFHPREFDSTIPIIKELSLMRKFKSYYNLHTTYNKLDYFLGKKKFLTLFEAEKQVDWSAVPVIRV